MGCLDPMDMRVYPGGKNNDSDAGYVDFKVVMLEEKAPACLVLIADLAGAAGCQQVEGDGIQP